MAESIRPEFDLLDSEGLEYHQWVSDFETTFIGKDYTSTIKPSTDGAELSEKVKANALMFLRRHIDPSLRWEYLQLKTPKELWDALNGRFGNIHNTLLPELNVQWNEIRLLDYKRVNAFNKDMLRLKAHLKFCEKEISEDEMIQKSLSTFPTSAMILVNQYRLEYDNKRITTFSKLINLLQRAERHNEVLLNNNARPVGTKKIPEANYGKVYGGKNPKEKGLDVVTHTHVGIMEHVEGVVVGDVEVTLIHGANMAVQALMSKALHKTHKNAPTKKERVGNKPCYRCGDTNHWYKQCNASNAVAASYKKYRKSKEQEAHYMEEEGHEPYVNFTVANFAGNKNFAQSMDVPDFD